MAVIVPTVPPPTINISVAILYYFNLLGPTSESPFAKAVVTTLKETAHIDFNIDLRFIYYSFISTVFYSFS